MDGSTTKAFSVLFPLTQGVSTRNRASLHLSIRRRPGRDVIRYWSPRLAGTFYGHLSLIYYSKMVWDIPEELSYESAVNRIHELAGQSTQRTSFIGDQLPVWKINPIVDFVSNLRPLSTSYTPYQPERSQGTLISHWIYQCAISSLTGFEAVNTLFIRSFICHVRGDCLCH